MGCGASSGTVVEPPPPEEPAAENAEIAAQEKAEEEKPVEVAVGGEDDAGITVADRPQVLNRKGGKCQPTGPFLPFIRFDISAVPKDIFTGDMLYFNHKQSNGFFCMGEDGALTAPPLAEGESPTQQFLLEKRDVDPGQPLVDGDYVLVREYQTGNYLTCVDDFNTLKFEPERPRGEGNEMQEFKLTKHGRPMKLYHGDTFFLMSWLSRHLEADTGCEERPVRAKRYRQMRHQQFVVQKVRVLEAQTTETARKMQFQSLDLDGNSLVTRSEMGYVLQQVDKEYTKDALDSVMEACTAPECTGATLDSFQEWADSGGLPEDQLQHAEAIGNIAQRCRDCLYEENCLIEVLTTIPSEDVQALCKAFESLTGEDLKEKLVAKTSEQDGYIFSNYWQLAMTQLLVPTVDMWCQALQDSMDGFGTDENTLTALVCTIPQDLRDEIHAKYKEIKGKSLLEHIDSETSFSYKKVLIAQANHPISARVQMLYAAMKGLGTSEDQLVRIITAADAGERREMITFFERQYDRSLVEFIDSETSGDFKKLLHAIFTTEEAPYDLEADCEALKAAMEGWGTDEEALIKLLCSKTHKQMEDIRERFHEKEGRRLEDWVKSETSGNFQATLMGLIRDPTKQLAYSVRDCIKGWGTDDTGLITLLTNLPEYARTNLIDEYYRLFKRDLFKDIKSDTSGDYETALLACLKPPPVVWAEALKGAMKGMGTSDGLLINFMVIAKDYMDEVRAEFESANGQPLWEWIEGDCSGDYKKTLVALAQRNSEDRISMLPIYWAQRCKDALDDVSTLKTIESALPAIALKRGTEVFSAVYQDSLAAGIEEKCAEGRGFSFFSNYWKMTMVRLLDMPIRVRARALNDAMAGLGTDEYTLTGLICTIPENTHKDVQQLYEKEYGRKLVDHIESETSFNYKKLLKYATMSKIESRCTALNNAMVGMGTDEKQLIRIILCSTLKERELIINKYEEMFGRGLIEHIESETSGHFQAALVATLESQHANEEVDYGADVAALKEAMDGIGTDEDAIIRIVASKTDEQIEQLAVQFEAETGGPLLDQVDSETYDYGTGCFTAANFRMTMLNLLRPMNERFAHCVRYCIQGWGTDDTGLITCCVHLPEKRRAELVETYKREFDRDLYEDIQGDTSGDYQEALLACVRPPVETYCHALRGAMKGVGTSDELLINWMCIAKDRMDEVRESFSTVFEGENLDEWIDGDCSGDYKDTLLRVARRECLKFVGVEVAVTAQAPPTKQEAVVRFNKTFNALCAKKTCESRRAP